MWSLGCSCTPTSPPNPSGPASWRTVEVAVGGLGDQVDGHPIARPGERPTEAQFRAGERQPIVDAAPYLLLCTLNEQ